MTFPKDFLWGVAASSYQIEGAALTDGRGECIWTRFSHTPGKVKNGDTGDIACEHYTRYPEDIALMKDLGLQAYRFSLSWPRVLPTGTGAVNPAGLEFYDRLVDEILKAGMQPWATLYHWDLPQALEDQGGWTNPAVVDWFVEYTDVITKRLGDRVKNWITHNEPFCAAFLGYGFGIHAPGLQDFPKALQAAHHLLVSHGKAVPVIRANVPDAKVGITLNTLPAVPASYKLADREAAWRQDGLQNRWFLDPVYRGHYPADMVEIFGPALTGINLDEVKVAAVPTDFLGVNYYNRMIIAKSDDPIMGFTFVRPEGDDVEFTAMDWEIYPPGLTDILVRIHHDYHPAALYVTENGAAFDDPSPTNGSVPDPRRVNYLKTHFEAAEKAIAEGAPLKGYFVWSFMDNFEWAEGYTKRFGIVYVDYETQKRTPKDSALYVKSVIAGG